MKKILLLALPLMVMCFASCEKKFMLTHFSAYPSEIGGNISALGGQGYIVYSFTFDKGYNPNVSVTCDKPSWLEYTYEVISYYGEQIDVRIDYIIESNDTDETRSATILIRLDGEQSDSKQYEVNITQPGIQKVIVSKPGTLTQELADKDLLYASSLKISGELNDKDLETIKGLREIETLDLTEAIIDDLPDEMFYENNTIRHVKLPESITVIHPKTFAFSSLEYVYFPANIETIEDGTYNDNYDYEGWLYVGAFANTNLKTVEFAIDSKLHYVGIGTFAGAGMEHSQDYISKNIYCELLTIKFPAELEAIANSALRNNKYRRYSGYYYTEYERFSQISISFEEHSALKIIGSTNARTIHYDASNCTMVESVGYFESSGKITVSIGTQTPPLFSGVSSGATLYVPKGCVGAYYEADGWKEFETIKEIGQE